MGSRFFDKPVRVKKVYRYESLANPPVRVPLGPNLIVKRSDSSSPIISTPTSTVSGNQSSSIFLTSESGIWLTTEDGQLLII